MLESSKVESSKVELNLPAEQKNRAKRMKVRSGIINGVDKTRAKRGKKDQDLSLSSSPSLLYAREVNRDLILQRICLQTPTARRDLARASGFQPSTVSAIVEQLLGEGWISEGEAVKSPRGRPKIKITLNTARVIFAAAIDAGRATFAIVDLNGEISARGTLDLGMDLSDLSDQLSPILRQIRAKDPNKIFEGVGLCISDALARKVEYLVTPPDLRRGTSVLQRVLSRRLRMTVEIETSSNACLLSELCFGRLDKIGDAILLEVSEGLSASWSSGGRLVYGRHGMVRQIGHVCFKPNGPLCPCGRRGCWELFASSHAALGHYRKLNAGSKVETYDDLCKLCLAGDKEARESIEGQAAAVGRGLRMITAALSPTTIFFVGDFAASWSVSRAIVERECRAGLLAGIPPLLVCRTRMEQARLLGAAALVLQRHTGFFRAHLLENAILS